ncbi:MAG: glyceraldehyde-3-phosphate dehydrogenase [Pseudomonadales bacterium]|nr:glyceraldehyde-3-phosphate dehydrogenase [Halioglobus sp.]MCP5131255.1 glyceraldehyde-3-phosphate dehydrogenase [Pseudomonadales bacterium]
MAKSKPIRVGIMGFGQTGRQIYELASRCDDIEVAAVADIGKPDILHYLLRSEVKEPERYTLQGNFLVNPEFRSRLMQIEDPAEVPWDMFGVDMVIDSTGKFRETSHMQSHLNNGARRVLLRTLPQDGIDRIVIPGINENEAEVADCMISAGSATTTALCLLLNVLSRSFAIECGSMTTIHSYTSDQALQDYAGSDIRRSRSAAENIIPNSHEAGAWLGRILPAFEDKFLTSALNVPIHEGCLLDVNLVLEDASVGAEEINAAMRAAALPGIVGVVEDPIVSSDVIGNPLSLLFDAKGTIKAGNNIIKTLSWYESLGHAARLLDVVRIYSQLDARQEAA